MKHRSRPLAEAAPSVLPTRREVNEQGTTRQPTQAARHARNTGAAHADEAAGAWWRSTADKAICAMADRGHPFSADDLFDVTGLPEARNPRALGARFLAAAHAGTIVGVGYTTSRRASAHAAVVRVWRGAWAVAQEPS